MVAANQRHADADLIRRFKAGDETAFTEIVEAHRSLVFLLALRLLRNHADAEEIASETFVRMYRRLPFFRGDCAISSWAYGIARNLAINRYHQAHRRAMSRTISIDHQVGGSTIAELIPSPAQTPADDLRRSEEEAALHSALARIRQDHRRIIILAADQAHSYEQISRALSVPIGTVKSKLARARTALRNEIENAA